ncbi:MAG TPA: hypothetical protein VMX17_03395 [Candidatus Glassbacteria bacterium]|nr:hypothetical protein [Candidatus Glassbacteria bacterium]
MNKNKKFEISQNLASEIYKTQGIIFSPLLDLVRYLNSKPNCAQLAIKLLDEYFEYLREKDEKEE